MKTIITIIITLVFQLALSQTMSEVIEGPRLKHGEIYLNHQLDISFLQDKLIRYREFSDSTIINIKGNGLTGKKRAYKVFIKAFNPLHYSIKNSSVMVVDSINLKLDVAYSDMVETFSGKKSKSNRLELFNTVEVKTIKERCLELMNELIQMDFENKEETEQLIKGAKKDLDEIKKDNDRKAKVINLQFLDSLKVCSTSNDLCRVLKSRNDLDSLNHLLEEKIKLISNVEKLLNKITEEMTLWENQYDHKNEWFIQVEKGLVSRKEMAVVTVKMIKHTVKINKAGNIIQSEDKVINEKIIRFRKYSLFIPEVAAGFIFTNQKFPTYTTKENDQGDNTVGLIDERPLEKLAISTLINFNINFRDSPILPFIQLGAGYSGKLPIGLIGGGLRFDFGENKNLALSSGISFTGIKDLNTLNEGEVVKDEAEIKNDLKYQFSGAKLYFGIQYNF